MGRISQPGAGDAGPMGCRTGFRGEKLAVLGGTHRHSDTVVIRFPTAEAANGWFNSAAYQALIPLRTEAAEVDLISFSEAGG